MGTLRHQTLTILNDDSLDDESRDQGIVELIEGLITEDNWSEVQQIMFDVLADDRVTVERWYLCLCILRGAALDKRPVDGNRILAYACLRLQGYAVAEENDFIWALVSPIKGVG